MDPPIKSKDQYQYGGGSGGQAQHLRHNPPHPQPALHAFPALPAYNRDQPFPYSRPQPSPQYHGAPPYQPQISSFVSPFSTPPSGSQVLPASSKLSASPAPASASVPPASPPASATASPATTGTADSYTDSPPAPEHDGTGDKRESEGAGEEGSARKKQKRNKPTLSCYECVERKTKVRESRVLPYHCGELEKKKERWKKVRGGEEREHHPFSNPGSSAPLRSVSCDPKC